MTNYNKAAMIEDGGKLVNINGRDRIMIAGMTQAAAAYDIAKDEIIVVDANDEDRATLAAYSNKAVVGGFAA